MRRTLCILSVGSLLTFTSCASIISGSAQKVKFNSTPQNASVVIDGVERGKTPFEAKLARKKQHSIVMNLDRYNSYQTRLTKKFNGWYLGNILFGGIIGFIIDPITGAMFNLSEIDVNAKLEMVTPLDEADKTTAAR